MIEDYLHLKGIHSFQVSFCYEAVGKFKEENDWDTIAYASLGAMKSFYFDIHPYFHTICSMFVTIQHRQLKEWLLNLG